MINQKIRYAPIIKFIKENNLKSICEIGSGSYGIGKFYDIHFTGIDINFSDYAGNIVGNKNHNMKRVTGSGTDIPLPDESYDLAFSLDMFEHLTSADRTTALREGVRVAKRFFIAAFPCGKTAKKSDQILYRFYRFFHRKAPGWLVEHLENKFFPTEEEFIGILDKSNLKYKIIGNDNIYSHWLLAIFESLPFLAKLSENISRTPFSPSCNWSPTYRKFFIIQKR